MLRIGVIIALLCGSYLGLKAQNKTVLSEESKVLLFTSVEYDRDDATKNTYKKWLEVTENHYEYLNVEYSPSFVFYKPKTLDSISGKYELKLYKILCENSENQSRFVLWYKDLSSEVWLRVGGYTENDFHLLVNYLINDNLNRKQLKEMVKEWQMVDPLYRELDWECLLKGVERRNTKSSCFRSAYYLTTNDLCINCNPLKEDQLNSIFSRMPLYGKFNFLGIK